jgi:methylenetetrahydrofolate reductase (NADPH)
MLHPADLIIAYPDGHPDNENDRETELRYLKEKIDAGANFIVTQLFYDVDAFLEWVKEMRARGPVPLTTKFV